MRTVLLLLSGLLLAFPALAEPLKVEVRGDSLPLQVKVKNVSPQPVSFRFIRVEMLDREQWVTVRESVDCLCGVTCAPSGYSLGPWDITNLKWDGRSSTCELMPTGATFRVAIDNSCVVDRADLRTLGVSTPISAALSQASSGGSEARPEPVPARSCDLQMDVQGSPVETSVRRKITFRGSCQRLSVNDKDMTDSCMDGVVLTELEDNQYSLLFFTKNDRKVFALYGSMPTKANVLPRTYMVDRYSTEFGVFQAMEGSCELSGPSLRESLISCSVFGTDNARVDVRFASDKRTWPEKD